MKGDLKSAGTDSDKAAHPFPSGRTLTMQPEEKSELSMTSTKTAYKRSHVATPITGLSQAAIKTD
jgi:hypothetical protein